MVYSSYIYNGISYAFWATLKTAMNILFIGIRQVEMSIISQYHFAELNAFCKHFSIKSYVFTFFLNATVSVGGSFYRVLSMFEACSYCDFIYCAWEYLCLYIVRMQCLVVS